MRRVLTAVRRHFSEKYPYYICTVISLVLLGMGIFRFPNAIGRLVESCKDFGKSIAVMFCEMFDIETNIRSTVNDLPDYSFLNVRDWFFNLFGKSSVGGKSPSTFIPAEWDDFKAGFVRYWKAFANKRNFLLYIFFLLQLLYYPFLAIMLYIPLSLGIRKLFKKYYLREQKRPETTQANGQPQDEPETGELAELPITDSKQLRSWRKFYYKVILPVFLWFVSLVEWIKERPKLWQFWLLLVLLYFNVFTILIEFIAFYIHLLVHVDVYNLYRQIYKLFLDLYAVYSVLTPVAVFVLVYLGIKRFIKYVQYEQIEREARDMEDFLRG